MAYYRAELTKNVFVVSPVVYNKAKETLWITANIVRTELVLVVDRKPREIEYSDKFRFCKRTRFYAHIQYAILLILRKNKIANL